LATEQPIRNEIIGKKPKTFGEIAGRIRRNSLLYHPDNNISQGVMA
jgi:hypothetical protein